MFTVKCPGCKHNQFYKPMTPGVVGKVKRCVYCGRSFSVHSSLPKTNIVSCG